MFSQLDTHKCVHTLMDPKPNTPKADRPRPNGKPPPSPVLGMFVIACGIANTAKGERLVTVTVALPSFTVMVKVWSVLLLQCRTVAVSPL